MPLFWTKYAIPRQIIPEVLARITLFLNAKNDGPCEGRTQYLSITDQHHALPNTDQFHLMYYKSIFFRFHLINHSKYEIWTKKYLISGKSENQYVSMITVLLSSYCEAHLVESYCKDSKILDINWLRYLFSLNLIKNLVEFQWRHHLVRLHILKPLISLEQKEIFEAVKQHFSSAYILYCVLKWLR